MKIRNVTPGRASVLELQELEDEQTDPLPPPSLKGKCCRRVFTGLNEGEGRFGVFIYGGGRESFGTVYRAVNHRCSS